MFKKSWLIGVLLGCMVGLSGSNADAGGYPANVGGWGAWPGSITVWSYWKGITNSDRRPTEVIVKISNLQVIAHYLNPGGNGGGEGTPFYPIIELSKKDYPNTAYADRNGWYYSEITFEDQEIIDTIDPSTFPPPPNPGWELDMSDIKVASFNVNISGWSDLDSDGEIDENSAYVNGACTLDTGGLIYICTQTDSWYINAKTK